MTAPEPPRPFYRNPWVIALVAGIVTITLMRPMTRREPDAPAPRGQVPAFAFQRGDAAFGSADLAGRPYVLGVLAGDCADPECQAVAQALEHLQKNYTGGDVPIAVVTVRLDPQPAAPSPSDTVLDTPAAAAAPLLQAMAGVAETDLDPDHPSALGLLLVDGQGRARGVYKTDELGVDEALHRGTHVLREERSR